jgi:hypothetical protein
MTMMAGDKMGRWQAKLPDWRLALTWLVLTFVAAIIFLITRLIDAFAEQVWARRHGRVVAAVSGDGKPPGRQRSRRLSVRIITVRAKYG